MLRTFHFHQPYSHQPATRNSPTGDSDGSTQPNGKFSLGTLSKKNSNKFSGCDQGIESSLAQRLVIKMIPERHHPDSDFIPLGQKNESQIAHIFSSYCGTRARLPKRKPLEQTILASSDTAIDYRAWRAYFTAILLRPSNIMES